MTIELVKGNLFDSNAKTLGCTVNCVGAMGAGIARAFRDRYPDLYYHYKKICRQRQFNHRNIALYSPPGFDKNILLIPTKKHWKNGSDIDDLEFILKKLRENEEVLKLTTVALPRLGCNHGGLDFDRQVHPLMNKYLGDSNVRYLVYT